MKTFRLPRKLKKELKKGFVREVRRNFTESGISFWYVYRTSGRKTKSFYRLVRLSNRADKDLYKRIVKEYLDEWQYNN
jgi:hypothetical protein